MKPGQKIGRYSLGEMIGAGAMAQVFASSHPVLERRVAIKILKKEACSDPHYVERFILDARAAHVLDHPNIVRVLDVDDSGAQPFIVMELVDGSSLDRWLVGRRVEVGDAARIGRDIAWALATAHQAGMVHRDVKPSNILIDRKTATVKLTDFGAAKRERPGAAQLTEMGQRIGTPRYMAPEQIDGRAVDSRADLFALGATLYELLTNKPAFEGNTVSAVFHAILFNAPRPLAEVRPDVPSELDELVNRLLAKAPEDRPASAGEVAAALEPFATGGPPSRTNPSATIPPSFTYAPSLTIGKQISSSPMRVSRLRHVSRSLIAHSLVLLLLASATLILYWLSPFFSDLDATKYRIAKRHYSPEVASEVRTEGNSTIEREIALNPLVTALVEFGAGDSKRDQPHQLKIHQLKLVLRHDILILIIGSVLGVSALAMTLTRSQVQTKRQYMSETNSVESLFAQEVEDTRKKAHSFYVHSIAMLSIGLAVAIFGIGMFVWVSPEITDTGGIVRASGVFLFIEAIAWFFFRQYVDLRRHHERFYKNYYMNRVNYLIAFKDMENKQYDPSSTMLAASLIKQDSVHLSNEIRDDQNKDHSTGTGGNPVFDVMRTGLEQMGNALKKEK